MIRILTLIACVLVASPARAQDVTVDEAPTIADFYQGPIVASGRVIGLGGAYIGVAEGAAGHLVNPVAFAYRASPFAHTWFDWDVTLSLLNVSRDQQLDIDQTGDVDFEQARFAQGGFNLKFGAHGFGLQVRTQAFDVVLQPLDGPAVTVTYGQNYGGLGYAFQYDDDWWLGVLVFGGTAILDVNGGRIASIQGGGLVLGTLYAPIGSRWRVGMTLRTAVVGKEVEGDVDSDALPDGIELPDGVAVPWQLGWGVSYVFGPRGGNVRPTFGEGDAPPAPDRRYVMVSGDLVVTGPAPAQAVAPDSLFESRTRRSGEHASYSLRVGAESEIWPDVLVVRGGTYFEPSRHAAFDGRFHATGGFDVHLGELIWDWSAGAVIDWAPAYLNWGIGLGFWY